MFEIFTITIIGITFLIAGTVKGVIGLGLPTVSLALLTVTIGLTEAMAVLLIPSLVTNFWQAVVGGYGFTLLRRLWLFFLFATLMVGAGSVALSRVDLSLLSALLGVLLVIYASISLLGLRFMLHPRQEIWASPLFGLINGVLTGMTGSFVVPGVMFLQALGLARDALIQAMGILFTLSTLALAVALQNNNLLTLELGTLSLTALLPAMIGMMLGQRIRQALSEAVFRRVFFSALLALGAYIILNAVFFRSPDGVYGIRDSAGFDLLDSVASIQATL